MAKGKDGISILIVDDEKDYADTQAELLRREGHEPVCIYSGEQAQHYLEMYSRKIDLALLDMYMGADHEGGLKLVELIAQRYPWIVPVVVTAHSDRENIVRCMEAGAFSYVAKDAGPALVVQKIAKAVERFRLGERSERLLRIGPRVTDLQEAMAQAMRKIHDIEEIITRIADEIPRDDPDARRDTGGTDGQ
jgi:DNA-binding NtrC family response regulator